MSVGNVNFELENSFTGMGIRKVSQIVNFDEFTDDGSNTDGDFVMNKKVPAGSFIIGSKVTVKNGFAGDTSADLAIGGSVDNSDYSGNTTHDVFTPVNNLVKAAYIGATVGLGAVSSDQSIYLTLTADNDFSDVTAGRMLVEVFYLSTNVELTDGGRVRSDL